MKRRFINTLVIALFLLAIPNTQYGQEVKNHSIKLELEKIVNPDYRYCMLAYFVNDSNFDYTIDEEDNSVLLYSAEHWSDSQFQNYFDKTLSEIQNEFSTYDNAVKEIRGTMFSSWKDSLPEDLFVLLFRLMLMESPNYRDGNQTCATSDPFCTTDIVTFHVDANPGGSCESGPYYGCLAPYIDRPPFWYHMKIGVAGAFTIRMTNSANVDIDYCCWGPFNDPVTPCPSQLTQSKYIDCGSSGSANEECDIPSSAQVGQYYIMVITKYNQSTATNITFQKKPNSGPGETDCGILPGVATNDGPYCVGETIQLHVNEQEGATYSWTGPNFTSPSANPTRPNCTMNMAGTYTCVTTVGTHSVTASTDVEVYAHPTANFNHTTVCQGSPTQFNSTSTTNPSGQPITSYLWNFGDGLTGSGQNVNHTYAQPGTYQVTLTVETGDRTCSDDITKTVTVYALPTANFEAPTVCEGSATQFTSSTPGGTAYNWNFGDGHTGTGQTVNHTYAQPGTYQATLTVETGNGSCSDNITKTVTVNAMPAANFTATSVCFGDDTQFTNSSSNSSSQTMNYLWEFGDGATSTDSDPVHHYGAPGNYNVKLTANCGDCSNFITHSVLVHAVPIASATALSQSVPYGEATTLSGSSGVSGTEFNYHWSPENMVVNPNAQNTNTIGLTAMTNTFTLTVTNAENNECVSTAQVTVLVEGSSLNAYVNATPDRICLSDTTQLHAITIGGAPNLTYLWEPSSSLISAPNVAEPLANPTTNTTYHCTISDGLTTLTVSVDVTVNYPEYEEETQYICPDDDYQFYGQSYSAEGDYDYITTTAQDCEKTITLHLRHYPSYNNAHTTTEFICPGESYLFHGTNYNETGSYPVNLHTTQGCDSIVWLNLTVRPANDTIVENKDICLSDTLIWHGNAYFNDGDEAYFEDVDNNGCLLVHKLHLRVGEYQSPPDSYDPNVFQCVPYDEEPYYYWPIAQREYYADTCDTIVVPNPDPKKCDTLYTLNLKFHKESLITDTVVVCDSYIWDITNLPYTSTNHHIEYTYNVPFGPYNYCDSTFVLDLTINYSDVESTLDTLVCDSAFYWYFTWITVGDTTVREEGYHEFPRKIMTKQGCDSIVTLKLTLEKKPSFDIIEGPSWVVGGSEFQYSTADYSIDVVGSHKTQWKLTYKDDTPFTKWDMVPYDNGDRVMVYIFTYEFDTIYVHATTTPDVNPHSGSIICEGTEYTMRKMIICTPYGTPEFSKKTNVDIYPNPNDGNMTLSFTNMSGEIIVKVFNMQGTLIDQFELYNGYESNTFTYNSDRLSSGIYVFSIASKEGNLTKKVVITK